MIVSFKKKLSLLQRNNSHCRLLLINVFFFKAFVHAFNNDLFSVLLSQRSIRFDISGGSDFRLYDGSDLKTYLLMRW